MGDSGASGADTEPQLESLYPQLRALARMHLANERPGHTLQATALVHEAYLRLLQSGNAEGDPKEFYSAAANAMRRILIDHARSKGRLRRGRGMTRQSLDALQLAASGDFDDILAVDDAIERLGEIEPRLRELVRLRFFAGLSMEEAARASGRSIRTLHRDWAYAKAWLFRHLSPDS